MINCDEFIKLSEDYNLIPIYEEIIADTETPVSLYRKLSNLNDYSFLLESALTGEKSNTGRFSFIGISPERVIKRVGKDIIVADSEGSVDKIVRNTELNEFIEEYINKFKVYRIEDLPPFSGGLVGYFGYEMMDDWEELYHNRPEKTLKKSQLPSAVLIISRLVVVYDHLNNTVKIIDNLLVEEGLERTEKAAIYHESRQKINNIIGKIRRSPSLKNNSRTGSEKILSNLKSNTSRDQFKEMVKKGKEYIKAGEVFQLVLSQKFSVETELSPFQIYRALRVSNPSPYLFYLNFPESKLIGSSPEVLVKVEGERVITRPLAGTRPRGENKSEDMKLESELLSDEKEKAEHIMLVDLGRNDLGRVCEFNSIEVSELMGVEYFSQVMHIVSQVEGNKRPEMSGVDVLKSVFPAGTVTGAPKIRAMELIDKLENEARGIYAGAVGYLDFSGNLDTCITIRTFSVRDNVLSAQVGAGIVADSDPEREYEETINKARALFKALEIAEEEEPYGLYY